MEHVCSNCGKKLGFLENFGNDLKPLCGDCRIPDKQCPFCGQRIDDDQLVCTNCDRDLRPNKDKRRIGESYTYKRTLQVKLFCIGLVVVFSIFPISFAFSMVNATTFICGTAIIIIIAYDFGFTYPKQVTITPENIEITNIFSKRNINISEINKIWEGYQSSFKSSFKCIFIEYKNGSKDRIRSCYLDEKSKQMLLSIR